VITADNITDAQIRELLRASLNDEHTYWACRQALNETVGRVTSAQIAYARGLCADVLNARAAKAGCECAGGEFGVHDLDCRQRAPGKAGAK
jgi:hypothetical protein